MKLWHVELAALVAAVGDRRGSWRGCLKTAHGRAVNGVCRRTGVNVDG